VKGSAGLVQRNRQPGPCGQPQQPDRLRARIATRRRPVISAKVFLPLVFEWGESFSFDWSEEGLVVGCISHRMRLSHRKVCAPPAFWLAAYPIAKA
jgi:hypothetical protein